MNHLGLFEGIGGFSLAAHWANWKTVGWVEINPFCQQVLKYHFPEAHGFPDIKKFSYAVFKSILRHKGIQDRRVDIITGGFPCQPYSSAGLRKGTDDPRHLWPHMLRTIKEFKPSWVVGENVRGIVNWSGGLVFEQVQSDLEAAGYEVFTFLLPACSVGAPHERYRTWFIAYRPDSGIEGVRRERQNSVHGLRTIANSNPEQRERKIRGVEAEFIAGCEWAITYAKSKYPYRLPSRKKKEYPVNGKLGSNPIAANSDIRIRCQRWVYEIRRIQTERHVSPCAAWAMGDWENFPTQSPLCGRNDGVPAKLARITVPSKSGRRRYLTPRQAWGRHRRESIQAYGNAIVPQVAFQIFKAINEHGKNN